LARSFLVLAVVAGIAGCAPASPPRVAVQPAPAGREGIILSMRSVKTRASEQPLQTVLLADGVGSDDARQSLVEFIVRADGATLSIVQPNDAGFHAGDRVVILRDDTVHLARPE
jgi:hypothetical protein